VVVHDNAYADITYEGYVAPSFLETPGAKDVGIELFSLSKSYNMTGWRVGAIVGNVSASAVQLEAAAGTLTRTAETTQSLSSQVAGASEEASSNMQSVASATEELSASVDEIGRRKAANVLSVKPDLLASANPGCTLQIGRLLGERGVFLAVAHPVEILDASIAGTPLPGR